MQTTLAVVFAHQDTPLETLEKVALDRPGSAALARDLFRLSQIDESFVLSTCNRTEIYVSSADPNPTDVLNALAAHCEIDMDTLCATVALSVDDDAASHLFKVAAGLESRLVGEGEILGQLRLAIADATDGGTVGPRLTNLLQFAVATGRRSRYSHESRGAPSIAKVAVSASHRGQAEGRTLIIGAGSLGTAVAHQLVLEKEEFLVCARRTERAARLTRRPTDVVPFERLADTVSQVGRIICTTAARHHLLTESELRRLRHDSQERMVIVDLSLPRNIDPGVGRIDGVSLLDLDDLTAEQPQLRFHRRSQLVEEQLQRFRATQAGRRAAALIADLHRHVREQSRAVARTSLGPTASASEIERSAHRAAGRLLHEPTIAIKELVAADDGDGLEILLSSFGLSVDGRPRSLVG